MLPSFSIFFTSKELLFPKRMQQIQSRQAPHHGAKFLHRFTGPVSQHRFAGGRPHRCRGRLSRLADLAASCQARKRSSKLTRHQDLQPTATAATAATAVSQMPVRRIKTSWHTNWDKSYHERAACAFKDVISYHIYEKWLTEMWLPWSSSNIKVLE